MEHDRSESTSVNGGINLIRACGLCIPSWPIPGVGVGGLVPRTENTALGGLPLPPPVFVIFAHTHHV